MDGIINVPTFAGSSIGTTGTGLDRIVDVIEADPSLKASLPQATIDEGAGYANAIDTLFLQGLAATDPNYSSSTGLFLPLTTTDIVNVEQWFQSNPTVLAEFTADHGAQASSGYHLDKGQPPGTDIFAAAAVNTVFDGMLHIGFKIDPGAGGSLEAGNIQNENGAENATIQHLADWYNYFLYNNAATGTGLDQITQAIQNDSSLAAGDTADRIETGAAAANSLNALIVQGMKATGAGEEGEFTGADVVTLNGWIQSDSTRLAEYQNLIGSIAPGGVGRGGFQDVFDAGAGSTMDGLDLINVVAEGVYDIGAQITSGQIANENGFGTTSVGQIATWLNEIDYKKTDTIEATPGGDHLDLADGTYTVNASAAGNYWIHGGNGSYTVTTGDGDSYVAGGAGNLTLHSGVGQGLFYGGSGTTVIYGGGDDQITGGSGANELHGGGDGTSITGGSGTNAIYAGAGTEYLSAGSGDSTIYGGTGYNEIIGGAGTDVIHAGSGFSFILAGNGATTLYGGSGDATVYGGSGATTIIGGAGVLQATAGSGDTTFELSSHGGRPSRARASFRATASAPAAAKTPLSSMSRPTLRRRPSPPTPTATAPSTGAASSRTTTPPSRATGTTASVRSTSTASTPRRTRSPSTATTPASRSSPRTTSTEPGETTSTSASPTPHRPMRAPISDRSKSSAAAISSWPTSP